MAEFVKAHGRKAKDVMTRQVISVSPDTSLQQIANLLEKHGIKRVPVIENGRLVGIVSRANLVPALGEPRAGFRRRHRSGRGLAKSHSVESAEFALGNCNGNGGRDCRPWCC